MARILVACVLIACCLSAQMQNSEVASMVHMPDDAAHALVRISGQPNQYFEIWGMLGPTWPGAELTPWGVVDIPIFLQNQSPLVMLASGFINWDGGTFVSIAAPTGITFSIQAIVGVNHPSYPIWWLTEAITLST